MAKKFNLTSELRGVIRLIFRRSPLHKAALQAARVEKKWYKANGKQAKKPAVWYKCAECGNLFKPNQVEVDHKVPIGPAPGTKMAPDSLSWDEFIFKVFCNPINLQVLCKDNCHKSKTERHRKKIEELKKGL